MQNKILAIIPARSGSKGLAHKNIKLLNGKPLMAYTIEAARKSGIFSNIIVSTDSKEYAEVAKKYGAETPYLRNKDISGDEATTVDVIIDTINQLKKMGKTYDYFMLLQPTSPLRNASDIKESMQLALEKDANAIVSMCECEHPIEWTRRLSGEKCLDGFLEGKASRRQEEERAYRLNGAIYLAKVDYFLQCKQFYKEKCFAYIMPQEHSIDIDTIYDFYMAKILIKDFQKS